MQLLALLANCSDIILFGARAGICIHTQSKVD